MLLSYNRVDIPFLVSEIASLIVTMYSICVPKSVLNKLSGKGEPRSEILSKLFFRISKLPGG